MPWHIESNNPKCSGYAVVKDADRSIAGCHPTRTAAERQLAALYANEPKMAGDLMQPDMPPSQDPAVLQDEFAIADAPMVQLDLPVPDLGGTPCYGVACIEGVPDGSQPRRVWAPGALTFAPTPFSFKWQPAEDHGHEGSMVAGRVDAIWRDGALIRWTGQMDTAGEIGGEAERLIAGGFVNGVSIMADDVDEADIELVYPVPEPGPMMPPVAPAPVAGVENCGDEYDSLELEPEMIVYHAGRVRSLTLLPEPAFVEATVHLGESPIQPPAAPLGSQPLTAAAVGPHDTATSAGAWDGPANEKRLPSPMPVATARAAYAWIDETKITSS